MYGYGMYGHNDCRVDVIDGDEAFRSAVTTQLTEYGMQAVGYADATEYEARWTDTPSCVLLDAHGPGPCGADLLDTIAVCELRPPVIALTQWEDIVTVVRAFRSGAVDCLVKPVSIEKIIQSIRHAVARDPNGRAIRRARREMLTRYATLSELERDLFAGLFRGTPNKQILFELNAPERTFKRSRARLMKKMRTDSVTQLIESAFLIGMTPSVRAADASRNSRENVRTSIGTTTEDARYS
jgi:two-component system response regulator FixJ